jgi:predicted nucleic acid-binding protein
LDANLWLALAHDAYLAAFAKCAGFRLVTFDQGFTRFPGLDTLLLTPDAPASTRAAT